MDDFLTLSNRLLSRCPAVGIDLSQQLINDAWATLQSRREWSWRRRSGTFAPPNVYQTGQVSTNVGIGQPTLLTGIGTAWTPQMIGRQIRVGGLLFPYYTIVGYLAPGQILIDQPWAGPDVVAQTHQIIQIYYPVPSDFGYWYVVVSVKDGYRLWTNMTESDLALLDPQRTNFGQTYAIAFRDYVTAWGGMISPVIQVNGTGAVPISTTSYGFTYPANATYIIQVLSGGTSGTATYQWMRAGQTSFIGAFPTSDIAADLMDGVQIYWPDGVTYNSGDIFVINAIAMSTQSGPRFELWPGPTFDGYLYPYIYIAKEYALTASQPNLPPFVANRGEVLLQMALAECARYPGADAAHPNIYFNLALAVQHQVRADQLIWDLERNDEEVGLTNITYQEYPFYPAPWLDGSWQQQHASFLNY